jgi:ribosomal protein L1
MKPSKAVKEYKEELVKSQKQNERLTALVGKVTVEKEWLAKKLKSFHLQVVADGLFSHHKWVFVQTLVYGLFSHHKWVFVQTLV